MDPNPLFNAWRTFGFRDPAGLREYDAVLPDRPSAAGFWDPVR
ncbi:hypothetical protein MHI24_01370 [Paenibacillus sp. FSL K6-1096]